MFNKITDLFNAELDAEINMLHRVLDAAGFTYETEEDMNKSEYRTWLISQLKHVPEMITDLREEAAKVPELEKKLNENRMRRTLEQYEKDDKELHSKNGELEYEIRKLKREIVELNKALEMEIKKQ